MVLNERIKVKDEILEATMNKNNGQENELDRLRENIPSQASKALFGETEMTIIWVEALFDLVENGACSLLNIRICLFTADYPLTCPAIFIINLL